MPLVGVGAKWDDQPQKSKALVPAHGSESLVYQAIEFAKAHRSSSHPKTSIEIRPYMNTMPTLTNPARDLQPFCSRDKTRTTLTQPFSFGEWTYATDGRIAVRVPRLFDFSEVDRAPNARIEQLFKEAEACEREGHTLPELPAIGECKV